MKTNLIIFGAGGHASKIVDVVEEKDMFIKGFVSTEPKGFMVHGYEVLCTLEEYLADTQLHGFSVHIAIGLNYIRRTILESIAPLNPSCPAIYAHSSSVSKKCQIADGTAVLHQAVVHRGSVIGKCCIIDSAAIIEHDCQLGDFINISPGAVLCGKVTIGHQVIVGANAVIREKITIGNYALIGAGAVVVEDIPPFSVAVGNPARVIRQRQPNEPYLT